MPTELHARLAEMSRRYPALQFDPNTGASKLDTDILFDTGSAELKPGAEQVLRELAGVLTTPEAHDLRIMVAGHTDDVPIAADYRWRVPSNWELSAARAASVVHFLQNRLDIDPARLTVQGLSHYRPVAPNDTPENRAANRRVEIFIRARK